VWLPLDDRITCEERKILNTGSMEYAKGRPEKRSVLSTLMTDESPYQEIY
jgi:hypothetical protein